VKIFSLEATNYRKLAAFHLILDGRNLKVAGTTGQGKTTAVSLLWEILETVGDPINNAGKEPGAKALVRVVFGTPERRYIAERKYNRGRDGHFDPLRGRQVQGVGQEFRPGSRPWP
jgi:ABC-type uncharacterized transport system ATPase subunit